MEKLRIEFMHDQNVIIGHLIYPIKDGDVLTIARKPEKEKEKNNSNYEKKMKQKVIDISKYPTVFFESDEVSILPFGETDTYIKIDSRLCINVSNVDDIVRLLNSKYGFKLVPRGK